MKIAVPIASVEEAEVLARAGAGELHCGFGPDPRAGSAARQPGGFHDPRALLHAIGAAHRHGATISLALNPRGDAGERLAATLSIAESFLGMGGDALIVSGLGLIGELFRHVPLSRIHADASGNRRMRGAALLYRELGVPRLALPRDATLDDACAIAAEVPGLEIEAFIHHGGLPHPPRRAASPGMASPRHGRRHGETAGRLLGPHALPSLLGGGVAVVRIASAESPTAVKLASVRMAKAVLGRAEAGEGDERVIRLARAAAQPGRAGHLRHDPGAPG
ncbi:U32 family peptidase [Thauera linaloolentis]|uniref:Uncharacterized protein n=1 Tax=Thauera linaloolentis (strain DSM 12138 / JCM 21573 / CCUG 41526 / CIP 105981 / IAM 15112 / NBRC 102519 / 47Lol) TaxID=1123367 RepID=N6YV25_THAL4|nr:U32 family peptidase [Thauera linaloolentis]ENO83814.1 hypothetical protein C666_18435 [Thauera linaloolentis 47Lol = DSM 12138]MCM8567035.1 U32 family peptidase [Thauera linaloolentis]